MSKAIDGFEPLEINHGNKGRKAWYTERIEQLENLCRDLYREGCYYWLLTNYDPPYARSAWCDDFCSRMGALGLLEGDKE